MKKILAVVIAVAMLAAMSVTAMAGPSANADTETAIEFRQWGTGGNDPTPVFGIHNPGDPTTAPTVPGAPPNDNWPDWVGPMQSWYLHFGERDLPAVNDGDTVTFISYGTAADALDHAGNPVDSLLGLVVQALVNTSVTPNVTLAGLFELQVALDIFEVDIASTPTQTLQGFDLELHEETGYDFEISFGAASAVVQEEPTLAQNNTQHRAAIFPASIVGFQWSSTLEGDYDQSVGNFSPGEAQAELTWTLQVHV